MFIRIGGLSILALSAILTISLTTLTTHGGTSNLGRLQSVTSATPPASAAFDASARDATEPETALVVESAIPLSPEVAMPSSAQAAIEPESPGQPLLPTVSRPLAPALAQAEMSKTSPAAGQAEKVTTPPVVIPETKSMAASERLAPASPSHPGVEASKSQTRTPTPPKSLANTAKQAASTPTPAPTPAISTSDSSTGSALHCDVSADSGLTESQRATLVAACPSGSPAVCGTSLAARINETPAGGILNLTGCTYTSNAINLNKAITIIGPTVSFPTANPWRDGMWLEAHNIILDRWTFLSAGLPVGFASLQNIQILNSRFEGYTGGPIGMWGEVRHILIEGNTMKNTRNAQTGFVGGRGNEGINPCPQVGRYVTIRNNIGDQNTNGWFGIELKCFEDVLIERNTLKGGHALISLPDSNRVTIRDNNLDLRGTAYWGVEVPKANDVRMENNTVQGDGSHTDAAFSASSGSVRAIIYRNVVINLNTLFEGPIQADVRWNCLTNVAVITRYGSPETSTISNNGPC